MRTTLNTFENTPLPNLTFSVGLNEKYQTKSKTSFDDDVSLPVIMKSYDVFFTNSMDIKYSTNTNEVARIFVFQ